MFDIAVRDWRDTLDAAAAAGGAWLLHLDPPYGGVVDTEWEIPRREAPALYRDVIRYALEVGAVADGGTVAVWTFPQLAYVIGPVVAESLRMVGDVVWWKGIWASRAFMSSAEVHTRPVSTSERLYLAEVPTPDGGLRDDLVRHRINADAFGHIIEYLQDLKARAGVTGADITRALGNQMAGHYFGSAQWHLPTREAWEIIADLFTRHGVTDVPSWDDLAAMRSEAVGVRDAAWSEYLARDRRRWRVERVHERFRGDVWHVPSVPRSEDRHPCAKALEVCEALLKITTDPGDLVCDPFMGGGSLVLEAARIGRDVIAGDNDPHWVRHVDAARRRPALPF